MQIYQDKSNSSILLLIKDKPVGCQGEKMSDLGAPKIDLSRFFSEPYVHEIDGHSVNSQELINSVSMISMKIKPDNVEHVKYLTTEGLSKEDRLKFIAKIRNSLQSDVFEMSTCNRVLYVGFE